MTPPTIGEDGFWDETALDLDDGGEQLDRRIDRGKAALDAGADGDEPETMATDAISNILTALFGPEGWHNDEGAYRPHVNALDKARELLDQALDSYQGDAEDYTVEDV